MTLLLKFYSKKNISLKKTWFFNYLDQRHSVRIACGNTGSNNIHVQCRQYQINIQQVGSAVFSFLWYMEQIYQDAPINITTLDTIPHILLIVPWKTSNIRHDLMSRSSICFEVWVGLWWGANPMSSCTPSCQQGTMHAGYGSIMVLYSIAIRFFLIHFVCCPDVNAT